MILSSLLRIGLPSVSFLHVSPQKTYMRFSSVPYEPQVPSVLSPLTITKWYLLMTVLWRSSLCYLFQSLVTSFLLGPNVFNNNIFCNIKKLFTSLSVRDQDPHPYKNWKNYIDWRTVRWSGTSCQWFSCKSVQTAWRQYTRENQFNISCWRDHEVITLVAVRRPVCAPYYICDVWIVLWEGNAPSGVATTCEHLAAASGIDTSISLWSFGRNNHHIM
jgi:hypothetical protein